GALRVLCGPDVIRSRSRGTRSSSASSSASRAAARPTSRSSSEPDEQRSLEALLPLRTAVDVVRDRLQAALRGLAHAAIVVLEQLEERGCRRLAVGAAELLGGDVANGPI